VSIYANTRMLPREDRGECATGETCHHGRAWDGEGCNACAAESIEGARFGVDDLAKIHVREVQPLSDAELDEIVYGYVTAATWTDLLHPPACPDCGESMEYKPSGWYVHVGLPREGCARFYDEIESETGSDPYEYGPEDLTPESLARVREVCASFASMPTLADVRLYEEWHGGGYDLANGRAYSALESVGSLLYFDASGHGAGFCDAETPELSECAANVARHGLERLREINAERRPINGMLRRLAAAASGHGADAVMMCSDGTIEINA
jgi:hypothetical protein